MKPNCSCLLVWLAMLVVVSGANGPFNGPAYGSPLGPSPYLSQADSPFSGLDFDYFYVETFEDRALNTPGVLPDQDYQVGLPGSATDSVDGDDGAIDGSGLAGHSLYSNDGRFALSQFGFSFQASELGALPTHVGIVWTDVGNVLSGNNFSGSVLVEAFDAANGSVGVLGPFVLGSDDSVAGGTAEDRFLGFTHPAGISRLVIEMPNSNDWEVDHLQYGRMVPEPGSAWGICAVMGWLASRSRRTA